MEPLNVGDRYHLTHEKGRVNALITKVYPSDSPTAPNLYDVRRTTQKGVVVLVQEHVDINIWENPRKEDFAQDFEKGV